MAATKTVYICGPQTVTWTYVSAAQVADVLNRWNAVRAGGSSDTLVVTVPPYEYHIDLAKVSQITVVG